jgi:carboxypeptidase Taq
MIGGQVRVMQAQHAYDELIKRYREEALLASCIELLGWDELTYMPGKGGDHRGEQMALLTGIYHTKSTDRRKGELLGELEASPLAADPLSVSAVNIREIGRAYRRATRLPRSLVEELARVITRAQHEWESARRDANFKRFLPWLERVIKLKRNEAEAVGYETLAYDALLEEYEPGARSEQLVSLFRALQNELTPLAHAIAQSPCQANQKILRREFLIDRQQSFARSVAAAVGFDFQGGRVDTTVHPFCSAIGPGDCRLATRFDKGDFSAGLFATLHEAGHGLYEQGLSPEHHGTPMAEVPSLGVHESQSRLWENNIGRSLPFWKHFHPLACAAFPEAFGGVSLDELYFAVNHVARSPIRATADEVTYNLHILARFDLERAMIAGDLPAADLPAAWNEAYKQYLGLMPANDFEGCLQDGHWGSGLIGYFPTYALGNLYAAQLLDRAKADVGNLDQEIAQGCFDGLLGWLREKVYQHGQRFAANALVEQATGNPLSHRPFVDGLRRKYWELYQI